MDAAAEAVPVQADPYAAPSGPAPRPETLVKFEELFKEAYGTLTPNVHDSVVCEFVKQIAPDQSFFLNHIVTMGGTSIRPTAAGPQLVPNAPNYEFGANWVSEKYNAFLRGRIDINGTVNGSIHKELFPGVLIKIAGMTSPEPHSSGFSFDADWTLKDSIFSGKIMNGMYQASFMQAITRRLAMGGEVFHTKHSGGNSYLGLGARYCGDNWVATALGVSVGMLKLSYHHGVTDRISLASEFDYNVASGDSSMKFGYELMLRTATFKGLVESHGRVAATLEQKLTPGLSVLMNGEIDHAKQDYKFGMGLQMALN